MSGEINRVGAFQIGDQLYLESSDKDALNARVQKIEKELAEAIIR